MTGSAIVISSGLRNIEVKNGTIAGTTGVTVSGSPKVWTIVAGGFDRGISGSGPSYPANCQFLQLRISGCRSEGLAGFNIPNIDQVTATQNGGDGIHAGNPSGGSGMVTNSTATFNGQSGINGATLVSHCTAISSGYYGIFGDSIHHCVGDQNNLAGIYASSVSACRAYANNETGIRGKLVSHSYGVGNGTTGITARFGVLAFSLGDSNGSVDLDGTGSTRTGNNPAP